MSTSAEEHSTPRAEGHGARPLTTELGALLQRVLDATIELLEADKGTIHLRAPGDGALEVVAQIGFPRDSLDGLGVLDPGTPLWRTAFEQHARVVVEDVVTDPRLPGLRASLLRQGVRSLLSVPLLGSKGQRFGVLSVYRAQPHRPSERGLRLLDLFWLQAEQAIESQRAEDALRLNEAGLLLALEAGKMGSFEWNIQTGEIRWSENLEAMHGLPPGTFDGTFESFQTLIHPDDRVGVLQTIRQCVETGADYEAEFRSAKHDGGTHWMLGKGKVLRDEQGRPTRMMGVCMDVSRRKRAEEAIRESDRRKDEFLAMISHELRNPLSAIVSASVLLDRLALGDAIYGKACGVIRRQCEQLTRIVNDLLDISRLTAGKLTLHRVALDLAVIVDRCMGELAGAHLFDHHRHERRLVAAPVHGDSMRLEQVISNLLTNAVKYTPASGLITVEVEPVGDYAVLRVRDTGVGIAPDLLPRIFDLFVQSERGLDRRDGGLGVGLCIVRRLVEAHGGRVEARSGGANQGAEIVVHLPLAAAAAPESARPAGEVTSSTRRRILIIDDNVDGREALVTLLQLAGHEVHEAEDGPSGLASASRLQPDAVLVDIGLPGVDGFEIARRLRAAGAPLRLIALTGYGHPDHRRRGAEAGFDAYLVKPIDIDVLLRELPGS
jgi:PAS domain S-box-containing protein